MNSKLNIYKRASRVRVALRSLTEKPVSLKQFCIAHEITEEGIRSYRDRHNEDDVVLGWTEEGENVIFRYMGEA